MRLNIFVSHVNHIFYKRFILKRCNIFLKYMSHTVNSRRYEVFKKMAKRLKKKVSNNVHVSPKVYNHTAKEF